MQDQESQPNTHIVHLFEPLEIQPVREFMDEFLKENNVWKQVESSVWEQAKKGDNKNG